MTSSRKVVLTCASEPESVSSVCLVLHKPRRQKSDKKFKLKFRTQVGHAQPPEHTCIYVREKLTFSVSVRAVSEVCMMCFAFKSIIFPVFHEGGFGIFGFAVLTVLQISFLAPGPKRFGFSVLMFRAVCGFYVILHSVFTKTLMQFSVFPFWPL